MNQGLKVGPLVPKGDTELDPIILIDYVAEYSFPLNLWK